MSEPRLYRPSNGSEGMDFIERTCTHCIHNDPEYINGCLIQARSMAYHIDHAEYPKEWVYDDNDRPSCTAFVDRITGEGVVVRCRETPDMFETQHLINHNED